MKYLIWLFLFLLLFSCKRSETDDIEKFVTDRIGKMIVLGSMYDSLIVRENVTHTIVSYVDSLGCISCKLQLNKWRILRNTLDSSVNIRCPIIFIVHPFVKKDIEHLFKSYHYSPDLCIVDSGNYFKQVFALPRKNELQTFLLDKKKKIVAIGNPIHNPKIRELYIKIIRGERIKLENESKEIKTEIATDKASVSLGSFDWRKEQKGGFTLKNIGDKPLIIHDVNTSCGCTSVKYSKEPIQPGKEMVLEVVYKAEHPEHFDKTITVYCNVETSPLILKISGDAK